MLVICIYANLANNDYTGQTNYKVLEKPFNNGHFNIIHLFTFSSSLIDCTSLVDHFKICVIYDDLNGTYTKIYQA